MDRHGWSASPHRASLDLWRRHKLNAYFFVVSLRATHPTLPLDFLSELLCLKGDIEWAAGEARKTPKGTVLGGLSGARIDVQLDIYP